MPAFDFLKKLVKKGSTEDAGGGPSYHPDMTQSHEGAASNAQAVDEDDDDDGHHHCGCGHAHNR